MPGDYPGKPDLDPCVKWWGPDRHIVIYYVSAGRELYFTTSVPDEDWTLESWSATGDLGELCAVFADFHPPRTKRPGCLPRGAQVGDLRA